MFKNYQEEFYVKKPESECFQLLSDEYKNIEYKHFMGGWLETEFISSPPARFEVCLRNELFRHEYPNFEKTKLLVTLEESSGGTVITIKTKTGLYIWIAFGLVIAWLLYKVFVQMPTPEIRSYLPIALGIVALYVIDFISKKLLLYRTKKLLE